MRIGLSHGCLLLWLTLLPPLAAQEPNRPQFERDVLPIFQKSCLGCHGPKARMAGLDLHEASLVLRGSENGPVVTIGEPQKSVLLKRVSEGTMPPGGKNRLTEIEIATIERWIESGTDQPARSGPDPSYVSTVTDEDRRFWSFQTLEQVRVPSVRQSELVAKPVDAFLLHKLEEKRLSYSRPADRPTFIRRAYLDLLGLPPEPGEVAAFVGDKSPEAFARLVDRLLSSAHFGERWGRHWLDLAGYVDTVGRDVQSNGYKIGDGRWKYRDYVVQAFNEDKPFREFLIEQIAGDELFDWRSAKEYTIDEIEKLVATGFLRTAEDPTDNPERDNPLLRYEVIHQTLDILTSSVVGLTVSCARCHNHKFDPISQKDYYSLMATLTPAYNPIEWTPVLKRTLADVPPPTRKAIDDHNAALDKAIVPKKAAIDKIYEKVSLPIIEKALERIAQKDREATKKAALLPEAKRNVRQKNLVGALDADLSHEALRKRMSSEDRATIEALQTEIESLDDQRKTYGIIEALYEEGKPPETFIHRRGDHESHGPTVRAAGIEVLSAPGRSFEKQIEWSSGRRLALAEWLTREGTPAASLVARVYVNRVWMHLFGEGLVSTAENLGKMGAAPTHPELLEFLATEFIRNGWSTKKLIRDLMLSRAYQQSSVPADFPAGSDFADPRTVDPDNMLLWRMRLRRLESEVIRDSMLAVSGKLNLKIGGEPISTITQNDGMVTIDEKKLSDPSDRFRRSMYLVARRRYNLSMLGVFDHPVMSTNAKERGASAVVLQSLMMMNDKEVLTQAGFFADRILSSQDAGSGDRELLEAAYLRAFGRTPEPAELSTLGGLLHRERERFRQSGLSEDKSTRESLASVCHVLFNANEFLYVE